jgi:hypothetical protein
MAKFVSSTAANRSIDLCRDKLAKFLDDRKDKSWHVAKAIMFNFEQPGRSEPEAVGAIYTDGPTYYGLGIRFEVRRGCEGRGFATAGLQIFRDEYWGGSPSHHLHHQHQHQHHHRHHLQDGHGQIAAQQQRRRCGPVRETLLEPSFFASEEMREEWEEARDEIRDVEYLIASTDLEDVHAQRVLGKLGLKPEVVYENHRRLFYRLMPAE